MSIQSEILRIQHNVANAYAKVSEKGGTVPLQPNSANLAAAVASIPAGGLTQEEADGRYLQLTGGTVSGTVQATNLTAMDELNFGPSGADHPGYSARAPVIYASSIGRLVFACGIRGKVTLSGINTPNEDYDATNKRYVDDAIAKLEARIAALEAK